MIERKLNIDLSSLWINREGKFIIRFLDTNENTKRIFAKRIKETAPYWTIRKTNGPSIQSIYDVLTEINPIIFSEGSNERRGSFNCYNIRTIGGWHFKSLCKAIYVTICLKRNATAREIQDIAFTTTNDWGAARILTEQNSNPTREDERRIIPITDIGIEDIANATRRAIENGAENIPNEMLSRNNPEGQGLTEMIRQAETLIHQQDNIRAYRAVFDNNGRSIEETLRTISPLPVYDPNN